MVVGAGVAGLDGSQGVRIARAQGPGRTDTDSPCRPFAVRSRVGRILEIRVFDVCSPEDIVSLSAQLIEAAEALADSPRIFADFRDAPPFTQAVADRWSRDMRSFNGKVVRSALLLDPMNETFNLQLERVVRCAGWASRRSFCDANELRAWLYPFLNDTERVHVETLLDAPSMAFRP